MTPLRPTPTGKRFSWMAWNAKSTFSIPPVRRSMQRYVLSSTFRASLLCVVLTREWECMKEPSQRLSLIIAKRRFAQNQRREPQERRHESATTTTVPARASSVSSPSASMSPSSTPKSSVTKSRGCWTTRVSLSSSSATKLICLTCVK
ncbi:hypothetical protein BC936DRAFT_137450 [Jimgerdemannia flammicorona]|uniref:Uncharacterized protein n=1 Tax=Jimgerdemannia flammicorona TaxID=994334 RepID=A0A433CXD2_9FUNG|nr:hypothetical protein BC936DRAFT_137450 [Jimgerdemannia flammicorona]